MISPDGLTGAGGFPLSSVASDVQLVRLRRKLAYAGNRLILVKLKFKAQIKTSKPLTKYRYPDYKLVS